MLQGQPISNHSIHNPYLKVYRDLNLLISPNISFKEAETLAVQLGLLHNTLGGVIQDIVAVLGNHLENNSFQNSQLKDPLLRNKSNIGTNHLQSSYTSRHHHYNYDEKNHNRYLRENSYNYQNNEGNLGSFSYNQKIKGVDNMNNFNNPKNVINHHYHSHERREIPYGNHSNQKSSISRQKQKERDRYKSPADMRPFHYKKGRRGRKRKHIAQNYGEKTHINGSSSNSYHLQHAHKIIKKQGARGRGRPRKYPLIPVQNHIESEQEYQNQHRQSLQEDQSQSVEQQIHSQQHDKDQNSRLNQQSYFEQGSDPFQIIRGKSFNQQYKEKNQEFSRENQNIQKGLSNEINKEASYDLTFQQYEYKPTSSNHINNNRKTYSQNDVSPNQACKNLDMTEIIEQQEKKEKTTNYHQQSQTQGGQNLQKKLNKITLCGDQQSQEDEQSDGYKDPRHYSTTQKIPANLGVTASVGGNINTRQKKCVGYNYNNYPHYSQSQRQTPSSNIILLDDDNQNDNVMQIEVDNSKNKFNYQNQEGEKKYQQNKFQTQQQQQKVQQINDQVEQHHQMISYIKQTGKKETNSGNTINEPNSTSSKYDGQSVSVSMSNPLKPLLNAVMGNGNGNITLKNSTNVQEIQLSQDSQNYK